MYTANQAKHFNAELKENPTTKIQMSRRSLSLPGRPSRLTLIERKRSLPLPQRKQVHWSSDLEEVIYFAPDYFTVRDGGTNMAIRTFDKCAGNLMRSRSAKSLSRSKRRSLKATQTLSKSMNGADSALIRTGMSVLSQQLQRFRSHSHHLDIFSHQSDKRWNELLALYQKGMRDRLEEQEEEWVWLVPISCHFASKVSSEIG